ncbi:MULTISPECIES: LolA family protein [Geobacter]|uniref:Cell envelope biogenesis protein LolA n=2 Tax=Geobacter TaxID=28231 RepID=A0A0C1QZ97_9BACT|nr:MULTISPECIES: outer membrane lipoprotein carrier protein LolA [Geobacter]ANA41346.1 cell envelope biogenesis protein LolA [Geobacter anodireducens]KIE43516.1 cell envelope biogenesis protein LolA [Geobacter soli]MBE2888786.1 outer membrane lipoprotein carrier protein LolA [Geobacter anodireducens]HMN02035.1 outer membrane lipoprotein carrier protein LolA [Geobacter anodireducens]
MTLPRILLLLAVTLLLGTGVATAAPSAPLADVVATLEQGYASLRDLQASFAQRTEMAAVKRAQTGSGELFIRKGAGDRALFRFNYAKPSQQIVSDGKTVWYYLPENRQVMTMDASALFAGGGGVALSYLTGIGQISRDFTVTFAGNGRDAKGNHVLDLVPKKQGQAFARLQLTVSARAVEEYQRAGKATVPFPIVSSVVVDQMGSRTSFEFSKIRVNRGLAGSLFTFKAPAGVEVIQAPGVK